MPVTGNHDEIDKDADRYASHFYLPDNGSAKSNLGTTYSFDYGPVHFVVLNTESKVKDQTEWLRKDLASTDKPWKIVALHDGPYGGSQEKSILKRWVPVFDEYEVAPGSMGVVEFEIPTEVLADILVSNEYIHD